jgi:hypothetical protein
MHQASTATAGTPTTGLVFTLARQAIELGRQRQHRDAGLIPFGALFNDDFVTLVLESLGQFGETTPENKAARETALNAYRTVAMADLPMTIQEHADTACWIADEMWAE